MCVYVWEGGCKSDVFMHSAFMQYLLSMHACYNMILVGVCSVCGGEGYKADFFPAFSSHALLFNVKYACCNLTLTSPVHKFFH